MLSEQVSSISSCFHFLQIMVYSNRRSRVNRRFYRNTLKLSTNCWWWLIYSTPCRLSLCTSSLCFFTSVMVLSFVSAGYRCVDKCAVQRTIIASHIVWCKWWNWIEAIGFSRPRSLSAYWVSWTWFQALELHIIDSQSLKTYHLATFFSIFLSLHHSIRIHLAYDNFHHGKDREWVLS